MTASLTGSGFRSFYCTGLVLNLFLNWPVLLNSSGPRSYLSVLLISVRYVGDGNL